jgi:hypothetical protein
MDIGLGIIFSFWFYLGSLVKSRLNFSRIFFSKSLAMLKREIFDKLPCSGIQFRVTREDQQMAAPPCNTSGATSSDFLSPHTFAARNSLCSVSGKNLEVYVVSCRLHAVIYRLVLGSPNYGPWANTVPRAPPRAGHARNSARHSLFWLHCKIYNVSKSYKIIIRCFYLTTN